MVYFKYLYWIYSILRRNYVYLAYFAAIWWLWVDEYLYFIVSSKLLFYQFGWNISVLLLYTKNSKEAQIAYAELFSNHKRIKTSTLKNTDPAVAIFISKFKPQPTHMSSFLFQPLAGRHRMKLFMLHIAHTLSSVL